MLNGKQKRYLRAMAVNARPIFQIGKDGLSENIYVSLNEALKARELVKVNMLKTCDVDMNEVAIELCAHTGSELVQKIGKTLELIHKPLTVSFNMI